MYNQKWLSLNFFAFFFTWGVFLPYWTGWLTNEKELSVSAASIIMGVATIGRALSTLLFFPLMTRKVSLARLMQILALLSVVVLALYIPANSYANLFLITVIFSFIYPNMMPAIESGATVLMQKDRVHYGKSRAYGSIGYTIALLIVGSVTEIWQENAIFWVMMAGLVFMAGTQFITSPSSLATKPEPKNPVTRGAALHLLKSKGFVIVLLVSLLLQGTHAAYYNYGFIYLQDLGINSFYIGLILNVAIVLEIIFFAKADTLFEKWPVSSMFLLAGVGSTIRWILIFLFPSVWVFIFSQLFHALSFGVAHYAFVRYIFKKLDPGHIPAAQGMYAALAMSLSVALLTIVGGFLYEISPGLAFLGMIAFSVPAVIIVLLTKKKLAY
ncbi:3-phenylpropionate MFS transporter [Planococcus sp. N028]|uniref:3-phenylpropionate MFS transporter n=1 Tax=Planococcus shixiaomingii TaxID=3058393 RepID=A0ABT8N644_9BACL|nr:MULTISPECIES: 3-phenylpropionate MFS transporter [unclassified Planococcus (in: firmicutes)]MDN7243360.1 3-phenylpropionate MFS transporter [Planococcus sp. N028]WKA55301.1 3-phenylpropionate MFS transporter [Planococcus sp. N022]